MMLGVVVGGVVHCLSNLEYYIIVFLFYSFWFLVFVCCL